MEVIILLEIGMPTFQTKIPEEANAEVITKDLEMADELCEATTMRIASNQQRVENLYNKQVKLRTFQDGDQLLRRVFENMANPVDGKFQPNWEGAYTVVRVGAAGSYTLNKLDMTLVNRMLNATYLKRYNQ